MESIEQDYMFHHAEEYQQRGWSVIPLIGKQAAVAWKEYQSRRPTLGELSHWFGYLNRGHGIGIVTGKISGLVVMDCDDLETARWWWKLHPTPLLVRTGKGIHCYYRHPGDEVRNSTGLLSRPLDRRGDGGYVVAPPTIHPEGKTPYEWIEWPVNMDEVPLYDPAWFPEKVAAAVREHPVDTIDRARRYVSKIVAIAGKRGHDTTFRVACKLREFGLTEGQAEQVMLAWNETNAKPKWTQEEIRHKLKGAFNE